MASIVNYLKVIAAQVWMRYVGGKGELKELTASTSKVYPGAICKETCDDLIDIFEESVSAHGNPRVWSDGHGSDTRLWSFEKDIGPLIKDLEIDKWKVAVEDYTGRKVRSWCLMANRVTAIEGNVGSGGGAHRDSPFSHQVKCIWYLNKVNAHNGPFQYVPGTNINLLRQKKRYSLGQTRFHELSTGFHEVHGAPGTLLVADTKCIHRGKPMEEGVRYAVTLYTFTAQNGVRRVYQKLGIGD